MKFTIKNNSDRIVAVFIFLLLVELCVSFVLAISCMYDYHFYAPDVDTYALGEAMQTKADAEFSDLQDYYRLFMKKENGTLSQDEQKKIEKYEFNYLKQNSNVLFVITDQSTGRALCNFEGEDINLQSDVCFSEYREFDFYKDNGMKITGSAKVMVRSDMEANDGFSLAAKMISIAKMLRYPVFVLFFFVFVAALYVLGILMGSVKTDVKKNDEDLRFLDKIPFDLLFLSMLAVVAFLIALIILTKVADVKEENLVLWNAIMLIISGIIAVLVLMFDLNISARIKRGHVYRNTVIYKFIVLCRKLFGKKNEGNFKVPYIGKVILSISVVMVIRIAVLFYFVAKFIRSISDPLCDFNFLYYAAFVVFESFIFVPLFLMVANNLQHIRESGQRMAKGDLDLDIDSKIMFGDFKAIGENLSDIRGDMLKAIDAKTRSQELRNELITNISHDLKTPLTNIVNYVNFLMDGSGSEEEKLEYLQIIKTNSQKVDTMLKDVIYMSKASTGDISVNAAPLDLIIMLEQTVAEFSDSFSEHKLEIVTDFQNSDVEINADGMLLWRVLENLMGNIVKYALSGTRVFINVQSDDEMTHITFKNVSAKPIKLTAEELVGRFVRDDNSRHRVDGSGLGLAIAKSLTEIQNGVFGLEIDGDIFKVEVSLPNA